MPADHREPGRLTHVAKVRFRSHIDIDSLPDWRFSEREWNPPELTLIRLAEPGSCTQRAGPMPGASFLTRLNSIPKIRALSESWRCLSPCTHTDGRFAPYGGRHCRSEMQWLPPSSSSLPCSLSLRCCCASGSPSKARIAVSRCVEWGKPELVMGTTVSMVPITVLNSITAAP